MRVRNKIITLAIIPLSIYLIQSIHVLNKEYESASKVEVMSCNLNALHALSDILFAIQLERGNALLYQNGSIKKDVTLEKQNLTDSAILKNILLIKLS